MRLPPQRSPGDIDRWKKMHVDAKEAVSLALFATTTLDVKAEAARIVATDFSGREF